MSTESEAEPVSCGLGGFDPPRSRPTSSRGPIHTLTKVISPSLAELDNFNFLLSELLVPVKQDAFRFLLDSMIFAGPFQQGYFNSHSQRTSLPQALVSNPQIRARA